MSKNAITSNALNLEMVRNIGIISHIDAGNPGAPDSQRFV